MIDRESTLTAVDVATLIGQQYVKHGSYVQISCYNVAAHAQGDRKPSLTIYDYNKGYYCYTCGESGNHGWLLKQFGKDNPDYERKAYTQTRSYQKPKKSTPPPNKDYTQYQLDDIYPKLAELPAEATEILERKGFGWRVWEKDAGYRWHTNEIPGWQAGIFIPYYFQGKMVAARLRCLSGNARFKGLPGGESFPYFMDKLDQDIVFVCEGESDTATLNFQGFPAVGVPGSTNTEAIRKIVARAAETGAKLVVIPDTDKAGQDFMNRMRVEAFNKRVPLDEFVLPGYKDVNEWFCSVGQEIFDNTLAKYMNEGLFAPVAPVFEQTELGV